MSAFKILAAGLACAAPLASAYTKPVGDSPSGNAISQPGLNSIVPVGKGFTITWEPTKKDCETVDLVLLKGPASDAEPQYAIAEKIDNDGSYAWTPKTDLAPSDSASPAMGYGIQLICDKSGAYQYTTQFGISNPDYKEKVSSSSAPSAPAGYTSPAAYTTSSAASSASAVKPAHASTTASAAPYHAGNSTTMTGTAPAVTGGAAPSGYKPGNSSIVGPTGSAANMSTTLATSATLSASGSGSMASASASASSPVSSSGAAAQFATSFGSLVLAAGVAVYVL